MRITRGFIAGLAGISLLLVACGGGDSGSTSDGSPAGTTVADTGDEIGGIATISVEAAASIADNPPDDLVVLDVRTPEEFAEGHLEGAVLVDFYEPDFADQLAGLDTDVPYLVYCHSGNRSGQALGVMEQLGFASAVDIDGGIVAWSDAGLPVSTG